LQPNFITDEIVTSNEVNHFFSLTEIPFKFLSSEKKLSKLKIHLSVPSSEKVNLRYLEKSFTHQGYVRSDFKRISTTWFNTDRQLSY
jgi:hypothetical protein